MFPTFFDKALLTAVRNAAVKFGIPKTDVIPSILYIYSKLAAGLNVVKFEMDDTAPVLKKTEQLLNKNNVHFTTHLGLAIHQVVSSAPANSPLDFYPDKNKYAAGTGAEAKELEQIYNAKLSFKTDSNVRLEKFKANIFRSSPITQNGSAAHPSTGFLPLVDVGTVFPIVGGATNSAWLDLDDTSTTVNIAGGSNQNYAVLLCNGFEVRNGSKNPDFIAYLESLSKGEVTY